MKGQVGMWVGECVYLGMRYRIIKCNNWKKTKCRCVFVYMCTCAYVCTCACVNVCKHTATPPNWEVFVSKWHPDQYLLTPAPNTQSPNSHTGHKKQFSNCPVQCLHKRSSIPESHGN